MVDTRIIGYIENGIVIDHIPYGDVWKIAESCFENGNNLKAAAYNFQNNKTGLPKNHHLIDELF